MENEKKNRQKIYIYFLVFSSGWKCGKKKFDEKKYFSQSFIVCKVEENKIL